ncbi:MAG: metal-sensing transcriptional repressor [Oscillospiraceae bacterium]|nr:metal-sensing transcriptional repressor [Oscillospiraceae bacterium]MBR2806825.1 metal-sensing transcriptional repressor [Oscillospiraceae bacterium]
MMADRTVVERYIKTARGQLDGILKMIDDDRYCVDISNQIMAADALLKKANSEILRAHMKGCVRTAVEDGTADEKIDEVIALLDKLIK